MHGPRPAHRRRGAAGSRDCRDFDPDVVGLQCNFTTERNRTLRARAARPRARCRDAFVVVGGHDASRDPDWFHHAGDRRHRDRRRRGGDAAARRRARARRRSARRVPGLVLRATAGWVATGHAPARPRPRHATRCRRGTSSRDYAPHYYINFRKPLALHGDRARLSVQVQLLLGLEVPRVDASARSRRRASSRSSQQIEAPNVFITDDIFWMNVKRGEEMAQADQGRGHQEVLHRADAHRHHLQVPAPHRDVEGLRRPGDLPRPRVGDRRGARRRSTRRTPPTTTSGPSSILKDLGVGFTPNFIVDPAWDRDDFARLRDWIEQMGAYNSGFSVLTPLPGTDLWDDGQAAA